MRIKRFEGRVACDGDKVEVKVCDLKNMKDFTETWREEFE